MPGLELSPWRKPERSGDGFGECVDEERSTLLGITQGGLHTDSNRFLRRTISNLTFGHHLHGNGGMERGDGRGGSRGVEEFEALGV